MMNRQQAKRQVDTRKLLNVLRAAKSRQDETGQPSHGRGLWLSSKLWAALTKHLEKQVSEVEALEQAVYDKQQEVAELRQQLEGERLAQERVADDLRAQVLQLREQAEFPLAELGALRAQMRSKQETWDNQKYELEGQMDRLMGMLRKMGLLADSEGQRVASAPSPPVEHEATVAGVTGLLAPEVQALQVRELSMLLADARHQAETYRRQLAMRSIPAEEMGYEIKRLKADNQRLVALLAKVPEYRAMAAEVAAESGVHYIPIEECLMIRGQVDLLYPQLLDRPVEDVQGQELAAVGRRRDPDELDVSLTLVLDEQYHWVPRKALEVGVALMRRMLPALPMSQLMVLVSELNKIWRDREKKRLAEVEAVHREELQRLQHTFQQRAPYEAVVAGHKLNDLKRRMRAQAAQAAAAAAAAKAEKRRVEDDSKVMLHAGLSSIQDLSRQVARLVTRNKKLAGKVARQTTLSSQPLCSACFDRLLLSDTLGLPMKQGKDQQPQQRQQDRLDTAPAAGTAATTLPGTPFLEEAYGYAAAYPDLHSPRSPRSGNSSPRAHDVAWGSPAARQKPDIPTLHLSGRTAPGQAAETETYNAGPVVRLNVGPPPPPRPESTPPHGAPQFLTGATRQDVDLGTSFAAAATAAGAGPADMGRGADARGEPGMLRGAPASERYSGRPASPGAPAAGSRAAAAEASAASLAEWRSGTAAPVTVQVQLPGGSPPGNTVLHGDFRGPAGAATQPRGVPVRVRLRFPRQDVIGTQRVQQ